MLMHILAFLGFIAFFCVCINRCWYHAFSPRPPWAGLAWGVAALAAFVFMMQIAVRIDDGNSGASWLTRANDVCSKNGGVASSFAYKKGNSTVHAFVCKQGSRQIRHL